jgi:hypothetical protein
MKPAFAFGLGVVLAVPTTFLAVLALGRYMLANEERKVREKLGEFVGNLTEVEGELDECDCGACQEEAVEAQNAPPQPVAVGKDSQAAVPYAVALATTFADAVRIVQFTHDRIAAKLEAATEPPIDQATLDVLGEADELIHVMIHAIHSNQLSVNVTKKDGVIQLSPIDFFKQLRDAHLSNMHPPKEVRDAFWTCANEAIEDAHERFKLAKLEREFTNVPRL